LVSGEINTLCGFQFVIIETRTEGGLTEASNIVDSWFFQRPAVGLAIGIDMKTEINWIPERTAWLTNGMLKAGSVVRDEGGLVKVQYDKTALKETESWHFQEAVFHALVVLVMQTLYGFTHLLKHLKLLLVLATSTTQALSLLLVM